MSPSAQTPARLAAEIGRAGLHPQVVLEACYGWYWAADALAAADAEVHLAHPAGVQAFSHRRVKNDELDARDLADLLRMGRLAEAWIAPPEIRELREITRYRGKLVHIRTSCKDQVHGVLAKLGIEVTCSDIFGAWGTQWLDELPLPQPYCWKQEVSLPGKIVGDIRLYYHDVPREETDLTGTTVEMLDGAQALWHSHPRGQIFFAISGLGQIQVEGGDVIELQPGDSIWAPPGERHCHGAAPGHA